MCLVPRMAPWYWEIPPIGGFHPDNTPSNDIVTLLHRDCFVGKLALRTVIARHAPSERDVVRATAQRGSDARAVPVDASTSQKWLMACQEPRAGCLSLPSFAHIGAMRPDCQ